jgi:hypothetical protein
LIVQCRQRSNSSLLDQIGADRGFGRYIIAELAQPGQKMADFDQDALNDCVAFARKIKGLVEGTPISNAIFEMVGGIETIATSRTQPKAHYALNGQVYEHNRIRDSEGRLTHDGAACVVKYTNDMISLLGVGVGLCDRTEYADLVRQPYHKVKAAAEALKLIHTALIIRRETVWIPPVRESTMICLQSLRQGIRWVLSSCGTSCLLVICGRPSRTSD